MLEFTFSGAGGGGGGSEDFGGGGGMNTNSSFLPLPLVFDNEPKTITTDNNKHHTATNTSNTIDTGEAGAFVRAFKLQVFPEDLKVGSGSNTRGRKTAGHETISFHHDHIQRLYNPQASTSLFVLLLFLPVGLLCF